MKATIQQKYLLALLGAASLFATAATSHAALYQVTVDTSSLIGQSGLSLDFQFIDGNGPLGNNTATISNFNFGSGGAVGSANPTGDVAGSLLTSFTFNDGTAFAEAYQGFTAGSLLTFNVSISNNLNAGGSTQTPDAFAFTILDSDTNNIPVTGGNSIYLLEIDTNNNTYIAQGADQYSGVTLSAVPEPSFALGGLALVGLCGLQRRRRVEAAA